MCHHSGLCLQFRERKSCDFFSVLQVDIAPRLTFGKGSRALARFCGCLARVCSQKAVKHCTVACFVIFATSAVLCVLQLAPQAESLMAEA